MVREFSAKAVTVEVLETLERRRLAVVADVESTSRTVEEVLAGVRREYEALDLPRPYLAALEKEVRAVVPARWRALAVPFSEHERRGFGARLGGDVTVRVVMVLLALLVGLLFALRLPPRLKLLPALPVIAAWFVPDWLRRSARKRYGRLLGEIADDMARAQPALERAEQVAELVSVLDEFPSKKDLN